MKVRNEIPIGIINGHETTMVVPPWWDLLVKLNNLREEKDKAPVTIIHECSNDNILTIVLSDSSRGSFYNEVEKVEYQLKDNEIDYIDSFILTESIKLITKNLEYVEQIPDSTIQKYKIFRRVRDLIITKIIESWELDFEKRSFDYYYNCIEPSTVYQISNDDYIFLDWSNLKTDVINSMTNFGYIIINNKIEEL